MSQSDAERLFDEGHAILDELDAFNEREAKERTMGSMASSSYRSDTYHRAMSKFHEAIAAVKGSGVPVGTEVRTRSGTYPSVPYVKQVDGSWKPKY